MSASMMPSDLTSSSDADDANGLKNTSPTRLCDFSHKIPRRWLINFYAYWLSMKGSSTLQTQSCEYCARKMNSINNCAATCRYVPPYLCNIGKLIEFAEQIYWSTESSAKNAQIALRTLVTLKQPFFVEKSSSNHANDVKDRYSLYMAYETILAQAQTLFEMFLRAMGSRALRRYISMHQSDTERLVERFCVMYLQNANAQDSSAGDKSIMRMLETMSSPILLLE